MVNTIVTKPESGTEQVEVEGTNGVVFDFAKSDIESLALTDEGQIVVRFVDDSTLIIENADELADAGRTVTFNDGQVLDLAALETGVTIEQPLAGDTASFNLQDGQDYNIGFNAEQLASVAEQNGALILTFTDGGQIVFANFAEALENGFDGEFSVDGNAVSLLELAENFKLADAMMDEMEESTEDLMAEIAEDVAQVETAAGEQTPQQLAQIEPAAGDDDGRGGFGFQSDADPAGLNPVPAIGPIGETFLQFDIPEADDEFLIDDDPVGGLPDTSPLATSPEALSVDETNLDGGPVVISDTVNVDFGADGPGTVGGNGDVDTGGLTSGGLPIVVTFDGTSYTGTAGGETIFTLTINPDGTFTFTLTGVIDHPDTTDPDDVVSIDFGVTATDADGDSVDTTITININDDGPILGNPSVSSVDETDLNGGTTSATGQVDVDFGADGDGGIEGNGQFDLSGLTSGGEAITVTFDGTSYTGTSESGEAIFTFTLNPDGSYEFTLLGPIDHPDGLDPNDLVSITFGYTATDGDGDSVDGTITININDDGPSVDSTASSVDETDLDGGPVTVDGQVNVDFGADGAGDVESNGQFDLSGLTSNGEAITVTFDGTSYTGTSASGEAIFTFTLNADGSYEFTLLGPVDHPDSTNPDDIVSISFGYTATDGDGDSVDGSIVININDDGPTIGGVTTATVDESDIGGVLGTTLAIADGTIDIDFGADGQGDVDANGDFNLNGVTSGGEPITVTVVDGGYIGTNAAGETIFTLKIGADGSYQFELHGSVDHPDGMDPNDFVSFTFGYTATDGDGDSVDGSIVINIADDAPSVGETTSTVDESDIGTAAASVTGQVSVDYGADGEGSFAANGDYDLNGITSGGEPIQMLIAQDINTGDISSFTGLDSNGQPVFTLTLNADGSYTFTILGPIDHPDGMDPNDILNITFGYTVTDGDGDSVDGSIVINIADDGPTIGSTQSTVDETDLGTDAATVSGQINVDFGADGAGSAGANGQFDLNGLTSGGEPISVTVSDDGLTYAGTSASGEAIFTFTLNADGTYTFTLLGPVDHPDGMDPNDILNITFGYTVTDGDGDSVDGSIVINIADDGPTIGGVTSASVDETDIDAGTASASGQVDVDFGADGAGNLAANGDFNLNGVTSGGSPITVTVTADGYVGTNAEGETIFTLTLNEDGSYEFELLGAVDHPDSTDPNDVVSFDFGFLATDGDGDSASGTITIEINDDGPSASNRVGRVYESDLSNGPIEVTRTMDIDFGEDGPGVVEPTGTFMATFQVGGQGQTLTAGGEEITVEATADGYVGMTASGEIAFTLTIDPATGTHTYTQFLAIDHPGPGQDGSDVIWLKFQVQVVDADGDTVNAWIVVDLEDDGPSIGDGAPGSEPEVILVDETDLDGGPVTVTDTLDFDFGGDGAGSVGGNGEFDLNGLTSGGQPITVIMAQDLNTGQVSTYAGFDANGEPVFTLTINADGTYTFTLLGPVDHPDGLDPNDLFGIEFGFSVIDGDGDVANGTITINIADDGPTIGGVTSASVDETDIDAGTASATGQVDVDFGADGAGNLAANGDFNLNGVTSGGQPITVTVTADGYVGTNAEGETIFTLTLNEDGSYEFELLGAVDHPDSTDPNDVVSFDFGFLATDGDGDSVSGTITIDINDDGPTAQNRFVRVNEGNLDNGPIEVTRTPDIDFGEDGPGTVEPTGTFMATFQVGGQGQTLTSGGEEITVSVDGNSYVGTTESGEIVFTVSIDPATGAYTYTQFLPVDHPGPGQDGSDVIWLKFQAQVVDADGDTVNFWMVVDLEDGGPSIGDGAPGADPEEVTVDETDLDDGPVSVSDEIDFDFGSDGPGELSANGQVDLGGLTSGGEAIVVAQAGNTYTGSAGGEVIFTLTINDDGTYEFTLYGPVDHPDGTDPNDLISIEFGFSVSDGDGDVANGTITVNINDDGPQAFSSVTQVQESDLDNGPIVITKDVNIDFGEDGAGTVEPTGNFMATFLMGGPGETLSSNGSPITVEATADGYIGTTAGGEIAFTLTIDPATGSYTYTQYVDIDHPGPNQDGSDIIWLKFEAQVVDADGDTDTFFIVVDLYDDGPDAGDPSGEPEVVLIDETDLDDGPASVSDEIEFDYGADGPGSIGGNGEFDLNGVTSGGQPISVLVTTDPDTGNVTSYVGFDASGQPVFTMVINDDGSYTFTLVGAVDHPDGTDPNDLVSIDFGYVVTDADGDEANGTITVNIADDGPTELTGHCIKPDVVKVDETDLDDGSVTVSDTINVDFGADGIGSVTGNGEVTLNGLTSGGVAIVVALVGSTYTGTANGEVVFTLEFNPDGSYDFTLVGAVDHPDGTDPDDVVSIDFGYTATDGDGDAIDGSVTVDIHDDAPVALTDVNNFDLADAQATGNVITGENSAPGAADNLSNDGETVVTNVSFGDQDFEVPAEGTVTIEGEHGTLEISADGTYTYTPFDGAGEPVVTVNEFDPEQADITSGLESLTLDGITVSVGTPQPGSGFTQSGTLTWVNTAFGNGIGIDTDGRGDSPKIWNPGETLVVDFSETADRVVFTLAEIGSNNLDDGIDFIVTMSDGSTFEYEFDLGTGDVQNGLVDIEILASMFGDGTLEIASIDMFSMNNGTGLGAASFLLNNIVVESDEIQPADIQDVFEYTIVDGDGDTSTAELIINGDADGVDGIALLNAGGEVLAGSATELEAALAYDLVDAVIESNDLSVEAATVQGTAQANDLSNGIDVAISSEALNVQNVFDKDQNAEFEAAYAKKKYFASLDESDMLFADADANVFLFEAARDVEVLKVNDSLIKGDVLKLASLLESSDARDVQDSIDEFVTLTNSEATDTLTTNVTVEGAETVTADIGITPLYTADINSFTEETKVEKLVA